MTTTVEKTYKRDPTIYVIGNVAFVANPASRSSWWKTHAAIAFAACPVCKAPVGQLCVPSFGFHRGCTHGARRRATRQCMAGAMTAKVVVVSEKIPALTASDQEATLPVSTS